MTDTAPPRRLLNELKRALIALLLVIATAFAATLLSPRPVTWLVSLVFDQGADKASAALEKHVPANVTSATETYMREPAPLGLDIHRPANATSASLPTVVWIHGGGWISGNKDMLANYLKVLAGQGMVTVSVDYTLAPDAQYPAQVSQANQALGWLANNADRLGLDMRRVFLAGDSAGAQIAAQLGNILTAPDYARRVGITPALPADSLRGLLLFCGPYDFGLFNWDGALGWPLKHVMWALSGQRDFQSHRIMDEGSVLRHVTAAFPPAFITVGNADPLQPQSRALAARLQTLGVRVDSLFFDAAHQPALGHEYQFSLDGADGRQALTRAVDFVRREGR